MAHKLNSFVGQYGNVKECEDWTTVELQRFQALMLMLKSPELDDLYQSSDDRRALRGDEQEHGNRWERLSTLAVTSLRLSEMRLQMSWLFLCCHTRSILVTARNTRYVMSTSNKCPAKIATRMLTFL